MSKLATRTIDDITETLIDYRGKTPPKSTSGVRLVTAKVIKGGFVQDENNEYVTESTYRKWMTRGFPKRWDILITTEAPMGEVAQLRTPERVALAQRVILLRGDPKLVDQQYYFHALKSPFVQSELAARATGTTVLGIKQSELRQVRIPYWPLPVQRKIGSILSAYDDLIENNERRIRILEEMARRLYREWFVHFRFPGHERVKQVESAVGRVPQGRSVCRLAEVATVNAASVQKGNAPSRIRYVDISSVSPGSIDKVEEMPFDDAPGRARRIVEDGDIIWSCVRPNRRSHAVVLKPVPNTVVSTGFAVITPRDVPYTYLYQALTTDEFVGYLTNRARGAAYPAVTASDFEDAEIVLPASALLREFDNAVQPHFRLVHNLRRRNEVLRATRDLLLPKLVSGEVDVSALTIDR